VGFVYLLRKKYLHRSMVQPMIILFLLGGLQGALGWIMVKSGLNEEDIYVNHIRLAIHFIAAMGLLVYTLWFAFRLWIPVSKRSPEPGLYRSGLLILILLVFQFIYGAFMAGLKAATVATTWPRINGDWIPGNITQFGTRTYTGLASFTDHPLAVHFIHRTTAYLLFVLVLVWCWQAGKRRMSNSLLASLWALSGILVGIQVVLGILTVLFAANTDALLWLGVAHQFVAMILLMSWVLNLYLVRPTPLVK
jgi:cytochrome c oxidase assembly protein subunit 15